MSTPVYDHYRNSSVEWLGAVPAHWTDTRLRFFARLNPSKSEVSGRARDEEVSFVPMDAVGEDGSLRLDQTRALGDVESGYTYFRNGDVAVAKITPCFENGKGAIMRNLVGGVGFGTTELIVARPLADNSPDFVHWLFNSTAFRKLGEGAMYGAGGQKRVPDDFVRDFPVALPPPGEQAAIAAFLARETGKIDALVEAQTRLIELLKEKRQAVISHAVTKGLDPAAPMKDSGVKWLGQVPAHWSIRPLKYLVSLRSGATPSKDNPDLWGGDVPWASAKDLKTETLTDTKDHLTEQAVMSGAASLVQPGAVVVLVRGMMLARTFPVCEIGVPLAINQDLKALLPRHGLDGSFLAWALRGTEAETLNRLDEAGHGTKALRMEAWLSLPVPVPPMHEQRKISAELVEALAKLAGLTGQAQAAIALLQERRAALISAAVTGKIDVRGLAPEQAEAA
ncbi:restriction endonuclease subunit S [Brevundimonas diminuta]|uniref:restriction endonuclease subunit S n=1 Tax=Brevundimonas diminuta TaxID=293 RepID=UPI003D9A3E6A